MPAMWVRWSRGASKGALHELVYMACGRMQAAPLPIDVSDLGPLSSKMVKVASCLPALRIATVLWFGESAGRRL